ncbi:pyrroline-5-carboxylate reductase, putative [Talaromyces stipitatus ATCC 10500]|uniref:Pyrroline-5-carboxylate reductase, putative n=1 Tax=Talaromyces stipitatus (strain ATCC 10500 / CBS 375.48 / QM 6759 / NRRL 1006) TaxID=441959 RepID=B8MC38_TALSN|nr:pyrroline-5-carboxylate reductase, putative [Talaromyces stipitatus ATCC 10500]EED18484.1 pyrroline-5-carboxylate reductase, putative [Talaromyces stipitatus ATCC 10500]
MAILGCGTMGTAILDGILRTLTLASPSSSAQLRPSRFIACVNHAESVKRLERHYAQFFGSTPSPVQISVWQNKTAEAVKQANIILLACQPSQAAKILGDPLARGHFSHKLLLNICVGVSVSRIHEMLYGGPNAQQPPPEERAYVVHAMPNTASTISQSATVLSSEGSEHIPPEHEEMARWILTSIGTVTAAAPSLMNAASVTGASTIAFFATTLSGVVKGAIETGLPEEDAIQLAAQAMKGTAELVLRGEQPLKVRDRVMTPNGCTEKGVNALQNGRVEEVFVEAMKQAVERVFELGRESSKEQLSGLNLTQRWVGVM